MSNRFGSVFPLSALCAAVAIVAAAPAMAQNTTAAIGGRVTAGDGKAIAGATVTIVHRESGSTNTLVTDAEGRYSARGLRVGGPYTVTAVKGSDRSVQDDVYLQLAESLSFDIRLGGNTLEQVVVTGSAAANNKFNSASMGAGTALGRQELDAYASIARNLQDYARQDPRLSQTDKERGEISAGGQNSRYNSITVDGMRINDTFGLESNNLPTIKQPISIDAIQSVQVNISNYDVTQQGYTGANINAVTKSGTNEFKGSVYYVYRDDTMGGRRFNRVNNTQFAFLPYKEDTKGVTLGGPIIKDKLFFFASYEELKSNRAQPEFGPIGSPLTNVAISQAAIDGAAKIAKDKYGIDIGTTNGPAPVTVKDALFKVDWNINENHRANIRYAKTDQAETNFGTYSATGLNTTAWWWNQKKKIENVSGQWFADWTPNFSTELKLTNRDYDSVPQNNSNLPAIGLQFTGAAPAGSPAGVNTGSRFLNFGTELSRQYNILRTKTSKVTSVPTGSLATMKSRAVPTTAGTRSTTASSRTSTATTRSVVSTRPPAPPTSTRRLACPRHSSALPTRSSRWPLRQPRSKQQCLRISSVAALRRTRCRSLWPAKRWKMASPSGTSPTRASSCKTPGR